MGYPATPQSDVYSCAVVLWEMLAGAPPFEHENALALAMMHRTDDLPPLGDRREGLSASFVAAIEAGLAKESTDRPDGATGFAALLEAGLKGDPVALAAATAPTAAIPRIAMQPDPTPDAAPVEPDHRETTMAMPRPESESPGIISTTESGAGSETPPRPPGRGGSPRTPQRRRNTPGLILLVLLLLVAAGVAFNALSSSGGDTDAEPTPSPSATTSPSPSATTPTPTPTVAVPAPDDPQPTAPAVDPPTDTDPSCHAVCGGPHPRGGPRPTARTGGRARSDTTHLSRPRPARPNRSNNHPARRSR